MEAAVDGEIPHRARAARAASARLRHVRLAAVLLAGVTLALALRAARLDFQPLWWDEGYSAWFATHSLPEMARLTAEDIHPPLYYALLHLWTQFLGPGPISLRMLSVVFGVLAIPVVYMAARHILGSQRGAVIAALLLALNPLHIYYSQEVRMYGLMALLSAGILWAAWEVMRGDRRLAPQVAYVALVTLALYTQYYAVFLPIGLTLYALWRWRRDARALVRWFALQGLAALLYLPWVIYAAPRLTLYVSQKVVQDADKPLGLFAYLGRHLSAYTVGHLEGPLAPWWPVALVLLLIPLAGLMLAWRRGRRGHDAADGGAASGSAASRDARRQDRPDMNVRATTRRSVNRADSRDGVVLLGTVLLTVLFLGWLIGLRYPFFPDRGERLLLLGLPAFVMLVAAGVNALLRAKHLSGVGNLTGVALAGVAAASLFFFYTVPRYPEDDYRPLIARTVEQGLPGDTVFAVYPWQVGYWRSYAAGVDGPTAVLSPSAAWGPDVAAALDDALARGRVWFPAHLSLGAILETQIERHLGAAAGAYPFANTWYGAGTRLSAWFQTDVNAVPAVSGLAGQYDGPNGELRVGAETPWQAPIPAANAVFPLILSWWQGGTGPLDATVSVRLVDDLGQIWGQTDYEPAGGMVGSEGMQQGAQGASGTDRVGLLIPAGTPPGRYSVELVVSTKEGAALPARVDGKTVQSLPLFTLDVAPADRALGPERLPIATRAESQLEDGIRFLGYTVDDAPLAPGESRRVNLFWQAAGQPSANYTAFVQALGRDGAPVAGWEAAPGASHPTAEWPAGTLMRTQATIRFPAGTPDGRYPLIAGLYNPATGARLRTERGAEQVSLGNLTVKGRGHNMNAPAPQTATDMSFGQIARLVGYDQSEAANGALAVTLHWQALGASDRPLTVFVHLLDEQGEIAGYGDGEPGAGAYPTTGWLAGEYLSDTHTVTIPTSPAKLRLAVGLYDPATGERLLTGDGQDQFVLELQD
jgi:4-amino-4-deoxy-L-arabinose transferase-like glycosyltransferase